MSLAAVALILCSCGGKQSEQSTAQAEQLTTVSVTTATRQLVPQTEVYASTIQAYATNNIASQTAGRIRKMNVEVGDFVTKGQVLAEMDRVQLDQAALQLKNSEDEYNRAKQLLEEGGVSQSSFESTELSYRVAKSNYDNLLENTSLAAPITGVVTARNYDVGDMYATSSPLYTIQQITPVKILVGVSEADYTKVKKGDKVTLTTDAIPDREFTGSVAIIYPTIDASSHTFTAEVHVKNEDRVLRPGMYTRITINTGDNNSIVVPEGAVVKQQGSGDRSVYTVENGEVKINIVTLGRHLDGEYEILSGIEEGDEVITVGQSNLKAGQKVEVAR